MNRRAQLPAAARRTDRREFSGLMAVFLFVSGIADVCERNVGEKNVIKSLISPSAG